MIPFAGCEMPVHYPSGIVKEHQHTRNHAGLFDVSHMGQIRVEGNQSAELLETLMPADLLDLAVGRLRYALLLNDQGGIIDDLMVTRLATDSFMLVANAACQERDLEHLQDNLGHQVDIEMIDDKSILALQGPDSMSILESLGQNVSDMDFLESRNMNLANIPCQTSRSGYTGEDGFEFSVDHRFAIQLAERILNDERAKLAGLGARDTLRLEAGLRLYGQDMTESTTPLECGLLWTIAKSRRPNGRRSGGFLGAPRIFAQMSKPPSKKLVGLIPASRAPVRKGAYLKNTEGQPIGVVTSGGFSPSLNHPICLAQVDADHATVGKTIRAEVRDREVPATVTTLPFVEHRYYRARNNPSH